MLSEFCIKRPIFATVLSLLIVLAGFIALKNLPLSQYPDITPPSVRISTTYDGADAETISRTVAAPIEDQLSGIEGLLYYTTQIRSSGDVSITCVFDVGTDPNDAMLEINNRVRTAERKLPKSVQNQGVTVRKRTDDDLLMVALWSPDKTLSATDVADYANLNIVDEIKRLPGIGDVSVYGNAQSAMRIWLDVDRMSALGITVDDVKTAIENQNTQRSVGRLGTSPTLDHQQLTYALTAPGQLLTAEQFSNIIVKYDGPFHIIRLRDIATTHIGKRSYEFDVSLNNSPGVNIGVYLQSGANALDAAKEVKAKMQELSQSFPKGQLTYLITNDTTEFVGASLNEVYKTLIEAGILVLLVVYLFLQNWRATLIPMLAVPVSLIGTMAGLWLCGFSLNTLTLFAMTLSIGIVVDDAIVVLENIERIIQTEKLSPFQAALKAMREVSGAIIAIVLVLSAVFIPVAFLGGIAGELYRQFAVTVAVSVVISGFVALTLTPALCAILLKSQHAEHTPNRFFEWFNQKLQRFTFGFLQLVKLALHHRFASAVILLLTIGATWLLIQKIPTSFVPKEDQGIVRAAVELPDGAAFPRTEAVAKKLLSQIESLDSVKSVVTMVGNNSIAGNTQPNAASFILQLKNWDDRTDSADDVQKKVQAFINQSTEAKGVTTTPASIPGLGSTNGFSGYITAHGNDNPQELQRITNDFIELLSKRPELTSLRSFIIATSPEIQVSVDEDKAYAYGVSVDEVYSTLSTLMGGSYINDFTRNGKTYRVYVQGQAQYRSQPEDLGRAYVRSNTGHLIPISALITWKRDSGADSISRMNGYLGSQIIGSAAQGYSSGEAIALVEKIAKESLPPGYQIEWTGQAFQEKRIGASSSTAFGFGLLVMFLILAALYERWSLPIAVVLAIPYALLGAMLAIGIRGTSNDIYFQIGLLVLVGLTAKNAILIVEFAAQKMEEGLGPFEAAIEAVALRLRPILMTSLAFILGVIPLVFATGPGAAARHSMGTGVFGGMLAATFISTVFVPVFFTWFVKHRKRQH